MKRLITLAKDGKINEDASVKDVHSIIINAPIDKVWNILIQADQWPQWNSDIKSVAIEGEPNEDQSFKWNFDGTKFNAQFQKIEKLTTLTWTGKSKWSMSIHNWQLVADDNQTIATLSTSLQGTFVILANKHQKVYTDLINWLEKLKEKAEKD